MITLRELVDRLNKEMEQHPDISDRYVIVDGKPLSGGYSYHPKNRKTIKLSTIKEQRND